MTVTFYVVEDDNRVVNKNLGEPVLTLSTVKCKEDVDILNPVLELKNDTNLMNANYFYVDTWERFYYITDKETNNLGLFITGHVDVLKTYNTEIRALQGVVGRNESKYNTYIPDEKMKISSDINVMTIPFPYGFSNTDELLLAVNGR